MDLPIDMAIGLKDLYHGPLLTDDLL